MSTSRWIQVDDTDSGISYTGSWFADNGSQNNLGHFGPPFLNTLHGTNSDGSFSYSFRGSRVLITGTVQYASTSTSTSPSWQCIIDGEAVGMLVYSDPENRLRLCERDGMDASQLHTITVKVSVPDQHTFWLDYVQYLPADSTTINNAYVSIDSSDPAIQFSDTSSWKANYPGYITSTTGASLTFQFQGVSISWLGFYDSSFAMGATTATYSIDGGTPVSFTVDGSGASGPGVLYNQNIFKSGQLSSGSHTLTVVYKGNSASTPLGLYTLVVQNGPGGSTSGGSGSGSSGVGTTGSGSGSVTTAGSGSGGSGGSGTASAISATASTTIVSNSGTINAPSTTIGTLSGISAVQDHTTASSSSGLPSASALTNGGDHASSNNLGPIIGGVIGALALVLIAIFGFFLLRRRNRRDVDPTVLVEPFNHDPQMTSYQSPSDSSNPFSDPSAHPSTHLQPLRTSKRAHLDTQLNHPNTNQSTNPKHARTMSGTSSSVDRTTSPSMSGEFSSVSNAQNSSQRNFVNFHDVSTNPSSLSPSDSLSSPGVVVDEDSGIRFRRTLQGGQMVQILPPVYSAS